MTVPSPQDSTTWERLANRRLIEHGVEHERRTRTALLYVPTHIRRRGGYPLVLVLHGGASSPDVIARASAMHRIAEDKGFVVAYPVGTEGRSGLTWKPGGRGASRKVGDARFVRQLIVDLDHRYDIDRARIFLAGFSIGGSLVYELAALLADRIAGVAIVSGTMLGAACMPIRPVPLIHIHGTNDRRVPFDGGRGPTTAENNEWPPAQVGIDWWRKANGCADAPLADTSFPGVTGTLYHGRADIELWLVEGGGHSWPGGRRDPSRPNDPGPEPGGFSASEQIWRFFASRPRRRDTAAGPE